MFPIKRRYLCFEFINHKPSEMLSGSIQVQGTGGSECCLLRGDSWEAFVEHVVFETQACLGQLGTLEIRASWSP